MITYWHVLIEAVIVLILSVPWLVFGQQSICICLDKISLRMVRSEKRHLYFIRRQRYIETVMRHTSNAGMQSCTKSYYSIEYSIPVQWPKAVDMRYKIMKQLKLPSSLLPRAPLAFLSRLKLPFPKLPFPSLSNACHAGYSLNKEVNLIKLLQV